MFGLREQNDEAFRGGNENRESGRTDRGYVARSYKKHTQPDLTNKGEKMRNNNKINNDEI